MVASDLRSEVPRSSRLPLSAALGETTLGMLLAHSVDSHGESVQSLYFLASL